MNNFEDFHLHDNINKAITLCGYTTPTPVQAQAIPEILAGKDVAVSAQTGTGKTASFVLPSLHNLSEQPPDRKTRILILTPTRELANQVTKAASLYGKFMRFNIVSIVGGMPYPPQVRELARGADIIVATPGRLMDHMEQGRVDLSHVSILVLDEADRMLDMGFIDDVQKIAKFIPDDRQTLLFSATLDTKLMKEVKHLLKSPVRIDLSSEKITAPQINQEMYKVNNMHQKTRLLKHFLAGENIYKAIIFTSTKSQANKLSLQLVDEGFAAAPLHGDLRQNVRTRTLEQLRRGKIQYLVATDVAARGIDVSDITHVFNYDMPKFAEDYVHRIGRTGRAGKSGTAISFVGPPDARNLQFIERYIGQRIKLMDYPEIGHQSEEKYQRDDKPDHERKSKFRDERDSHDEREGGFSHGRKEKSFRRDEHKAEFSHDRKRKPFSQDERGSGFSHDRKKKSFSQDERGSGFQHDRKRKSFSQDERGSGFSQDRKKKSFSQDERGGGFSQDRKKKSFSQDERGSGFSQDRKKKSFSQEERGSGFQHDRKRKSFSQDERGSGFSQDRKKKSFSQDERGSGFSQDRKKKSFSRDERGSDFKRDSKKSFKSAKPFGKREDRENYRDRDRGDASSHERKRHKPAEHRVEFKESHRKADGEGRQIRVEFKEGKPRSRFGKPEHNREQRDSRKPRFHGDRENKPFRDKKKFSSDKKFHDKDKNDKGPDKKRHKSQEE